jgi:hypothetical protein
MFRICVERVRWASIVTPRYVHSFTGARLESRTTRGEEGTRWELYLEEIYINTFLLTLGFTRFTINQALAKAAQVESVLTAGSEKYSIVYNITIVIMYKYSK